MSRWTNWLSRHPFTMKITGSNHVRDTKIKIMKYVFRGHVVFEYKPNDKFDRVVQGKIHDAIPAFDFCHMVPDDYKFLAKFFDTVYRHIQGEDVPLEDIEVY